MTAVSKNCEEESLAYFPAFFSPDISKTLLYQLNIFFNARAYFEENLRTASKRELYARVTILIERGIPSVTDKTDKRRGCSRRAVVVQNFLSLAGRRLARETEGEAFFWTSRAIFSSTPSPLLRYLRVAPKRKCSCARHVISPRSLDFVREKKKRGKRHAIFSTNTHRYSYICNREREIISSLYFLNITRIRFLMTSVLRLRESRSRVVATIFRFSRNSAREADLTSFDTRG